MRRAALALGVCVVALHARAALAAVVVVDDFSGAKSKQVRTAVAHALERDHQVVSEAAARVPRGSVDAAYVKSATEYHAEAFVDGDVKLEKSGWSVKLTVHDGSDGSVLGETTLKAPKLPKLLGKVDHEAADKLARAIEKGTAPKKEEKPAPSEEPAAEEAPREEEPKEDKKETAEEGPRDEARKSPPPAGEKRPVLLELAGGMQAFSRSFEYHQDVNGNLHPYHLSLWPALEARVGYYPGAHFTRNMAANVGIVAGITRSFGASSSIGGSSKAYDTTLQEIIVGARFRLPLARHELGASFLYGSHRFDVASDHDPNAAAANGMAVNRDYVPDASYQYLRPGLDARLVFGRFRFGAGIGYRIVLGLGELTSSAWFPHATAQALDGFIDAGYEVLPGFFATAGFDATRYALDMHTVPADRNAARDIAGGAIDQYLTGHIGVEYRFDRGGP